MHKRKEERNCQDPMGEGGEAEQAPLPLGLPQPTPLRTLAIGVPLFVERGKSMTVRPLLMAGRFLRIAENRSEL